MSILSRLSRHKMLKEKLLDFQFFSGSKTPSMLMSIMANLKPIFWPPELMLKAQREPQAAIRESSTRLVKVAGKDDQDEANVHFISIQVVDWNLTPRLPTSYILPEI